jgi:hypothetical protein
MAAQFDRLAPGVMQSDALQYANKEARDIEIGATKGTITLALGALALSAGFLLGDKRTTFPLELLWVLEVTWGLLLASAVLGLINWATLTHFMNKHAIQLQELLEGKRGQVDYWPRLVRAMAVVFIAMVVACVVGIAGLGYLAVALIKAGAAMPGIAV